MTTHKLHLPSNCQPIYGVFDGYSQAENWPLGGDIDLSEPTPKNWIDVILGD